MYTLFSSFEALDAEFPVSIEYSDWNFNLKTLSWQCDITPTSVKYEDEDYYLRLFRLLPVHQETRPQLNANDIVAWSEQHFGDFLCLIASLDEVLDQDSDFSFAPRGPLTLGAVVHRQKGIIAYFPSLPSPKHSPHSFSRNICASYSREVPHRIDFEFRRPGEFAVILSLHLSTRLVAAFLSQSSTYTHYSEHPEGDIVTINEIRILLVGTFLHDLTTQPTPVYLFVPPIPVEHINGMHCVHELPPDSLFYWSLGSDGKNVIPKENWEKYGVPELRPGIASFGSNWVNSFCGITWEYLRSKNYNPDGKQYARDHGYPELLRDDPYDVWFQAESFSLVKLFGEDEPDSKVLIKEQLNAEPNISTSEGSNEALNEKDTCSCPPTRAELVEAETIEVHNQTMGLNVNVPRPEGPSSRWPRLLGKLGFESRRPIGQRKTKTKRRILRNPRALLKKDGV
ncbi:hypothetical protein PM082_023373 [Marasmius tenuissimus]|nr:hypothetical protein PM082_023373 [Marasmius tenuissimus]